METSKWAANDCIWCPCVLFFRQNTLGLPTLHFDMLDICHGVFYSLLHRLLIWTARIYPLCFPGPEVFSRQHSAVDDHGIGSASVLIYGGLDILASLRLQKDTIQFGVAC